MGRTVTKAMLGRLSDNPNVLDHFYRGNRFETTYDLGTKGQPLKHPILNDHCDTVGELTWVLRLFSQMFRLSKSRHRLFILS